MNRMIAICLAVLSLVTSSEVAASQETGRGSPTVSTIVGAKVYPVNELRLVFRTDVQKELGITEAQQQQLLDLVTELQANAAYRQGQGGFGGGAGQGGQGGFGGGAGGRGGGAGGAGGAGGGLGGGRGGGGGQGGQGGRGGQGGQGGRGGRGGGAGGGQGGQGGAGGGFGGGAGGAGSFGGGAGGAGGSGGSAGGGGGAGGEGGEASWANADVHQKLFAILTTPQERRFTEISLQMEGNLALQDPAVQRALNITSGQKKTIRELTAKHNETLMNLRFRSDDQQASESARAQLSKDLDEDLGKLLSDEQVAKLKALQGREFAMTSG